MVFSPFLGVLDNRLVAWTSTTLGPWRSRPCLETCTTETFGQIVCALGPIVHP